MGTAQCPGCERELQIQATWKPGAKGAFVVCVHCEVPLLANGTGYRLFTSEERAQPGVAELFSAARRQVQVWRSRREQVHEAVVATSPRPPPSPRHGLTQTANEWGTVDDSLGVENMRLEVIQWALSRALVFKPDHVRYRVGQSDETVAAAATDVLRGAFRAVERTQISGSLRRKAVLEQIRPMAEHGAGVTAADVAQARGALGQPLRDLNAAGVVEVLVALDSMLREALTARQRIRDRVQGLVARVEALRAR